VVTEGFTGNIALKAAEGTAKTALEPICAAAMQRTLLSQARRVAGRRAPSRALKDRMDPRQAQWRRVPRAQRRGREEPRRHRCRWASPTAIDVTLEIVRNDLVDKIKTDVELMTGLLEQPEPPKRKPSL